MLWPEDENRITDDDWIIPDWFLPMCGVGRYDSLYIYAMLVQL